MNRDLASIRAASRDNEAIFRSTSNSFAEKGLVLKDMAQNELYVSRLDPETPSATLDKMRIKQLMKDTFDDLRRMNRTHQNFPTAQDNFEEVDRALEQESMASEQRDGSPVLHENFGASEVAVRKSDAVSDINAASKVVSLDG